MSSRPTTVTLKQVAAAAGVSVSVASRVLNGHAKAYRISDQTEQQVRGIASELDFRPSQIARSLRLQKSKMIGVVIPDLSNPFFAAISREIALAVEAEGFSVLVADSRETTSIEQELTGELQSRQVEGLVVCPVGVDGSHLLTVHQSGLPIVLVDRGFPDFPMMQVTSDHRRGSEQAAELLLAQGHRTIGILQGLPGTLPNEERLGGLRETLQRHDLKWDADLVDGDNFTEQSGYESTHRLLSKRPDITALFALSTPNAMGALRATQEQGIQVPDELSIVSFDDSPYSDLMAVPLATVCQDVPRIGKQAAALIIQSIQAKSPPKFEIHQVTTKIVKRSSIAKASPR
ncbi:LacI family DNA-binding transcriptional regulator [Roseimaritima multifibrata]|nr:LacI family DNA-binding transcriptional regulator [Roseimaritima multifibrata]